MTFLDSAASARNASIFGDRLGLTPATILREAEHGSTNNPETTTRVAIFTADGLAAATLLTSSDVTYDASVSRKVIPSETKGQYASLLVASSGDSLGFFGAYATTALVNALDCAATTGLGIASGSVSVTNTSLFVAFVHCL